MTTDKEIQEEAQDFFHFWPGQWLIQQYENGVPIEEVKKAQAEMFKGEEDEKGLIALSSLITEKFYKMWDEEGNKK